jgi:hypothetical protein
MKSSPARIASIAVLAGSLLLLWACYSDTNISYSNPQDSEARQWLIEYRSSEGKLQLSMSYRRAGAGSNNGFSFHNSDFGVTLDQLVGLTREQMMSSTGTNVTFQLKRRRRHVQFRRLVQRRKWIGPFYLQSQSRFFS